MFANPVWKTLYRFFFSTFSLFDIFEPEVYCLKCILLKMHPYAGSHIMCLKRLVQLNLVKFTPERYGVIVIVNKFRVWQCDISLRRYSCTFNWNISKIWLSLVNACYLFISSYSSIVISPTSLKTWLYFHVLYQGGVRVPPP